MLVSSRFNFTTAAPDGTVIIFNALSGQTVYATKDIYRKEVLPVLRGGSPATGDNLTCNSLIQGGFVRQDGNDELKVIKDNYIRQQYRGDRISVTIIPAQECNFTCPYCFEQDKTGRMSQETADQTVQFLREWIYPCTTVSLYWYGGEPLLALDIIQRISAGLRPVLAQKKCIVNGSIITNGYLLDAETVSTLLSNGIQVAQITVDGDESTHDRFRALRGGTPTYRRVVENLVHAARAGLKIDLRVNIGKHSQGSAFTILNYLASQGVQQKITVSFGQLDDLCGNSQAAREMALVPREFARLDHRRLLHQLSWGYPIKWDLEPRPTYCSSVRTGFILITHDGRIGKCWNRAGNEMKPVGHVREPLRFRDKEDPYLLWDPLAIEKCQQCAYLPLCMGGCPDRAMRNDNPPCLPLRYTLKKRLRLRYLVERSGLPKL